MYIQSQTINLFTANGLKLKASGVRGCLETVLDDMQPVPEIEQIELEQVSPDCVWLSVSTPVMVSDPTMKFYADVVQMVYVFTLKHVLKQRVIVDSVEATLGILAM